MSDLHHQRSGDEPVDILLVEDNPGDARLTREAFKTAEMETTLHVVPTVPDAVDFLRQRGEHESVSPPALVLLDLNLPGGDGCEVLEAVRDDERLRCLPVIVLTSSTADEDIERCYEARANAYLTKPREIGELFSIAETVEAFWFEQARLPPVTS